MFSPIFSEHYGDLSEPIPPTVSGVDVVIYVHIEDEFINQDKPVLDVFYNKRPVNVLVDSNPIFAEPLPEKIKEQVIKFIQLNYAILNKYWVDYESIDLEGNIINVAQ